MPGAIVKGGTAATGNSSYAGLAGSPEDSASLTLFVEERAAIAAAQAVAQMPATGGVQATDFSGNTIGAVTAGSF